MFEGFSFVFEEGQSIEQLAKDLTLTKDELKFKEIKKNLKEMGINEEAIKALETMTTFSKINERIEDVDIKGCITGQKFPLLFWCEDEVLYEQLKTVYDTGYKDKLNIERLIEYTEAFICEKLPTTEDKILEINKLLRENEKDGKEAEELGGKESKAYKNYQEKREALKKDLNKIINNFFPEMSIQTLDEISEKLC